MGLRRLSHLMVSPPPLPVEPPRAKYAWTTRLEIAFQVRHYTLVSATGAVVEPTVLHTGSAERRLKSESRAIASWFICAPAGIDC
jgi:hypothetical protein